jgi:DNA modification methylase
LLELNKTYNIDCLDGLKQMIEKNINVDCIITDPPFGKNHYTNRRKVKGTIITERGIKNDGKDNIKLLDETLSLSYQVLKNNSHIYWFCSWDTVDVHLQLMRKYFTVKNALIWDKKNHGTGDLTGSFAGRYEIILFGHKGRRELNEVEGTKRHDDIIVYPRIAPKKLLHGHQKPVGLLQFLIKKSTNENEIVLDMFAGVRSTEIAAKLSNRQYIGFELDEKIYEVGQQRDNELLYIV